MNKVVWSHSRINLLLSNPKEYFLVYEMGIKPKIEKSALSTGSALHWCLENETDDATEYYNEKGSFRQWNDYTDEQCLVESMASAYFRRKDEIYKDLLSDGEEILEVVDIQKELSLTSVVPSKIYKDGHNFLGIIDLLIITNKGFVLVDYKTSSKDVEWEKYLSQLYKYKYQINYNFPELPLLKVAIINLKKTNIRRHKCENDDSFKRRIQEQYLIDDSLIDWHIYKDEEFGEEQLKNYINDLSEMFDLGQMILDNKLYFLNYSNIVGMYGPSPYAEIYYHDKSAPYLYIIKDTIYDSDYNILLTERDCEQIDMLALENKNVMNKYSKFKEEISKFSTLDKTYIFSELKKKYICSDKLLEQYWITFQKNY